MFPLSPYIGTGGTFFKFLPVRLIVKVLKKSLDEDASPQIYLHPYEFLADMSFKTPFSDMQGLPLIRKVIVWIRQFQWHYIGNSTVQPKLKVIFKQLEIGGTMQNLLSNSKEALVGHCCEH